MGGPPVKQHQMVVHLHATTPQNIHAIRELSACAHQKWDPGGGTMSRFSPSLGPTASWPPGGGGGGFPSHRPKGPPPPSATASQPSGTPPHKTAAPVRVPQ